MTESSTDSSTSAGFIYSRSGRWFYGLARLMFKIFFRVKLIGDFNVLSNQKKLVIIANHESFLDGPLLALFLPVKPVFVVHAEIFRNPWLRFFLRFCDYFVVESAQPFAIKKILKLINEGRPIVIFPEGRLTATGSMMKIYEGPAFIAAKSGAAVAPIYLNGTLHSHFTRLSKPHPRRFFPEMTIKIFPLTQILLLPDATPKQRRRFATEQMRQLMQLIIFKNQKVTDTLYSRFLQKVNFFGKRYRLIEDKNQIEYSYGYLLKMVLVFARLFDPITQLGQKVGVLMPNLASTVSLFMALNARGRIPALLNYSSGVSGIQNSCVAADIHLIITSRKFIEAAKLSTVIEQLTDISIIYLEDLRAQLKLSDKLWVLAYSYFPKKIEQKNDVAVILFTSGSEGKPKGVALSHSAILSNIAQLRAVIDFSVKDKIFNALPIFHAFGLMIGAVLPLLEGVRLFLYPSPLHYRIIPELVYDRSCTVLAGTNTFLAKYAQFAHPYDFYSIRYVVAGAEKLMEGTRELWFNKFGLRILEGYGATEAAPVIAMSTPMAYKLGAVGQLMPGMESRVEKIEGIDEGGLFYIKGPNVMMGYYRYESPGVLQPTSSLLGKGWYDTGDVVTVDSEGFIRILGRIKRFAKIAGEMVPLEVVEKIAYQASPEKEHVAITFDDEKRGEQVVICTTDQKLTREQLLQALQKLKLPEIFLPKRINYLHELPLLGSGKPDYVQIKQNVLIGFSA
jgi:acyl-[acyl-carrier-protein]-phospholipid O-acyltransferase/long-chain-fatty-acid--[acyl-carrier-protein] ligase